MITKKYNVILFTIAVYVLGFMIGIYAQNNFVYYPTEPNNQVTLSDFNTFNITNDLINIILNNFLVAIFLSFFGVISGGILTIIVLFWNGLIFSFSIIQVIHFGISLPIIIKSHLIYIPLEVYAFGLFGEYGLKGFSLVRNIFLNNPVDFRLPPFRQLFIPSILLLLACILEYIAILLY